MGFPRLGAVPHTPVIAEEPELFAEECTLWVGPEKGGPAIVRKPVFREALNVLPRCVVSDASSVGVVNDKYLKRMHDITTSSLGQLQTDLKALHQQMTVYAGAMGPGETEFHQIRANAQRA